MNPKITMEFTLNPSITEAERIGMILALNSLYEGMMHLPHIQTVSYHNDYANINNGEPVE